MGSPFSSEASGNALPEIRTAVPGPRSLAWLRRFGAVAAPMGRRPGDEAELASRQGIGTIVYESGRGSNVVDVDGNRYVDFAAGFGSLLLGHAPAELSLALSEQSDRLWQSLGDLHPSDVKVRLLERLAARFGSGGFRGILGQSGADALSAALKTAALATGKPGVVAFSGAYHGLSYGPLASCGLRESYRKPFAAQLNPSARFVSYPASDVELSRALEELRRELAQGDVGAIVFEPILGRAGCVVPPAGFVRELATMAKAHDCLTIADEVWTGLGRAGAWSFVEEGGMTPDLLCLGKGLGGGLPLSACLGSERVMSAWARDEEVVHTSTYAGAPLACATGLALLDQLEERGLVERAREVGQAFKARLSSELGPSEQGPVREVRGAGLMIGIDLGTDPGAALAAQRGLLERGYIVSLGGGTRHSLVLTPPLDIDEPLLESFTRALVAALAEPEAR